MYLSELAAYAILFVTVIATFINPFIGLLGYYTLSFYRPQEVYWWSLGGSNLSLYVALAAMLAYFLKRKTARPFKTKSVNQDIFMTLLWVFITIATLFSMDFEKSWNIYYSFSKVILFYFFLSSMVQTTKRFELLVWVTIGCFTMHAINANLDYFSGAWAQSGTIHGPGIQGGVFWDRNALAMIFVVTLPLVFFTALEKKNIYVRIGLAAIFLVLVHAILITWSRGGFIGMAVVLLFCFLKTPKKLLTVALLIVFIPIFFRLWGVESRERVASAFLDEEERDASAQGRIEAWVGGLGMMEARPIVGFGFGNYGEYASYYNPSAKPKRVAHSSFLQIGAENGVGAMICFILLIFVSMWNLQKLMRYYKNKDPTLSAYSNMIFVSILGYSICAIFLSIEQFEPFYFLVGLTAGLKKLKQIQISSELESEK